MRRRDRTGEWSSYPGVADRVGQVLKLAADEAQRGLAEARAEAARIIENAQRQAEQILADARARAGQIDEGSVDPVVPHDLDG